ncbi:MAG: hypothetical protein AB7V62_11585 [Thermoleophilia bacterium]
MSRFVLGDAVPAEIRRVVALAEERLDGAAPDVVVAVGADDPSLAGALPAGPRVVVPALASRRPGPWARALLATADVTVLVDPCEAPGLLPLLDGPVVVTGVPAPPETPAGGPPLDTGRGSGALRALWEAEGVAPPPGGGAGVSWVAGPAALAGAAAAWAAGNAVVTLPGAPRHDMLRRGGALRARSSLEVVEATRFLLESRPLAHELARRGRRQMAFLDPVDDVVARFGEALLLAQGRA